MINSAINSSYLLYKKFLNNLFFKIFFLITIKIFKFFFRYIYYLKLKKNNTLLNLFNQYYSNNNSIPWEDIYFNYNIVLKKKPDLILELGCGYSTITFAEALSKLDKGCLISLEQSKIWLNKTNQICKQIDYFQKAKCKIILSDVLWKKIDHLQFSFYEKLPQCSPDIILVDGPDHKGVKGENYMNLNYPVSGDLLNLEKKLKIGTIIIFDGRFKNFNLILKKLKRKYKKTINHLDSRNILELLD
jgi:hypothetical protein